MAGSGLEAIAQLHKHDFDLILLDVMMPDLDGREVLAHIRAVDRFEHIPVIMVSALDGVESVTRCLELGANDYVRKPFSPVELSARVRSVLGPVELEENGA